MAENIETLEESLQQYELQLQQVTQAISCGSESSEELVSLKENLRELITLTKESLNSLKSQSSDDPLAEEYALFKQELDDQETDECDEIDDAEDSIQSELNCLIGTKCQAPFREEWSESDLVSYHNALIMGIEATNLLDNIKVKVMFTNPTCKKMVPCQFFLDGECKFTENQCHFSHCYETNFSDLKPYKEPNFNLLKKHVAVLAKDTDKIWKRAIVTSLDVDESRCTVRFESGRKEDLIMDIQDTLPLTEDVDDSTFDLELSDKLKADDEEGRKRHEMLVEKSLLQEPPTSKLGEWEKYTNSIGSRLMANMGYVVGTGLGKRGDGRIEPVTATVLPPGRSLDHCMALREASGGDPNLFSVDRIQKKLQKHVNTKKRKINVSSEGSKDVFSFINDSLSGSSSKALKSKSDDIVSKQTSTQALNVKELRLTENMHKKNYELMVLREKLSRQKVNSVGYNTIHKKVKQAENELNQMHSNLKSVNKEQSYRQTMKELTEF